jgi:adenosylhomocysteine nucleosidase
LKVLVTLALENEFAPWRKMRDFKRVSVDGWDHSYRTTFDGLDVQVFLTGAGRFAAQRAAAIALGEVPDVCIVSGLSGGLRPEHPLGRVLAARTVADAGGSRLYYSDSELLSSAVALGATRAERFLTADHVVGTAAEKQELGVSADAVDLESLWILAAAGDRRVPALAVRAISDTADSNLPLDFDRIFNERGAVSIPKVIGQLATRPLQVGGLIRLAHDSERAASNLAAFLDSFMQSLTAPPLIENAKSAAMAL